MKTTQLQTDKLNIINWITEIQDATVVEKIKSLMNSDDKPSKLSDEQMQILEEQVTKDRPNFKPARALLNDLQKNRSYKIRSFSREYVAMSPNQRIN